MASKQLHSGWPISDLCLWKPDISYKLRTADVCEDCLTRLQERGASPTLIIQALKAFEALRKHMLFSKDFRGIETDESKLPFPVAYTRRKLSMTIEPPRKFLLLIDHFDSLVRTTVIFLGAAVLRERLPNFSKEKELDGQPSLGNWVSALQSLTEHSGEFSQVVLPNDLRARIQAVVSKAEQAHIETKLLSGNQFGKSERDRFQATVKVMMGNHPDFKLSQISYRPEKIENIPYKDHCYLYCNNGQWITLHPYVQFKECPVCHMPRILLADGQKYLDPYAGHRG